MPKRVDSPEGVGTPPARHHSGDWLAAITTPLLPSGDTTPCRMTGVTLHTTQNLSEALLMPLVRHR
jgi:hypothetical protein